MPRLPSLSALRCFDASVRHGSFTRAAGEVHLTQGAVSHQILALEEQLGVRLFERKPEGLQLTGPGRAYWSEVNTALRQLERATYNLVTYKGQGGSLDLSVASTFASYWLMPRLSSFVSAHPEVTLNLSTRIGSVDFARADVDASIEYCAGATQDTRATLVMPLLARPYVAPHLLEKVRARGTRQPTALLRKLIATVPLIRHTTVPEAWRGWLDAAGLADDVPPERLQAGPQYDLLSMALQGVIAGIGIALLPDYVVTEPVRRRQLVCLSDFGWAAQKAYYLRYPEWKAQLEPLRRFEEWLVEAAARQRNADGRVSSSRRISRRSAALSR